ncbi:phosphatidate cytidylyltransferase [Dinoroseobacter shibae DFL 12 = DSM 16493]|jgi:phosphatidate cytidylyltransferase|uniref:Phosphatidate cytidylyltransferase n=1 Tax=Dinoroseobacter shibae (strain DSM 16493 / NCIMB 14021 / DFL 12) TaxID=398580 RepID=A8LK39_DINSH|nr:MULTISPECIES: phosphatidate cytidylyltransferase [Dinoroseobacter]ABV93238.1 phosphatidate cytidylyltransferase [Dinoroseobacter shibae DFL 12 = DSM 16493]MDD9715673.1 phosphatidate cytidylyltransferase [Dinoroseobacter sp. PD6]URF48157.1 phosphatidate cytidylyltransferase [Dinoroseobacter shibae]URF52467.1 phosphatidate cytidylyltransferase [Dinoroseobacter shibae]
MPLNASFEDLLPRLASAVVMVLVGVVAIWYGGYLFLFLLAAVVGAMVWELARMVAPEDKTGAVVVAGAAAAALASCAVLPLGFALPLLILPAMIGVGRFESSRRVFALYTAFIGVAGLGLWVLRQDFGMVWMLWLVLLVVVTDVAGYFAGRIIGGPKFWPRVSPKKTWSGTVAGWIGAGLVGWGFMTQTIAGAELIGISIALAMASQLGDVTESALKRRAGVKDSSALIPGHGGLLDRFDGMLGASVLLLLVEQIIDFPPLPL